MTTRPSVPLPIRSTYSWGRTASCRRSNTRRSFARATCPTMCLRSRSLLFPTTRSAIPCPYLRSRPSLPFVPCPLSRLMPRTPAARGQRCGQIRWCVSGRGCLSQRVTVTHPLNTFVTLTLSCHLCRAAPSLPPSLPPSFPPSLLLRATATPPVQRLQHVWTAWRPGREHSDRCRSVWTQLILCALCASLSLSLSLPPPPPPSISLSVLGETS
jgi:hypothetical protein